MLQYLSKHGEGMGSKELLWGAQEGGVPKAAWSTWLLFLSVNCWQEEKGDFSSCSLPTASKSCWEPHKNKHRRRKDNLRLFQMSKIGLSRVTETKTKFPIPWGMEVFSHRHFLRKNMQGEFTFHSFWHLDLAWIYMSLEVQGEMEIEILELILVCSFSRDTLNKARLSETLCPVFCDSCGSKGSSFLGSFS